MYIAVRQDEATAIIVSGNLVDKYVISVYLIADYK